MAQVTYRGVAYDTEEYNNKVLEEATKRQRHELMYRGVKVQRKICLLYTSPSPRDLAVSRMPSSA